MISSGAEISLRKFLLQILFPNRLVDLVMILAIDRPLELVFLPIKSFRMTLKLREIRSSVLIVFRNVQFQVRRIYFLFMTCENIGPLNNLLREWKHVFSILYLSFFEFVLMEVPDLAQFRLLCLETWGYFDLSVIYILGKSEIEGF